MNDDFWEHELICWIRKIWVARCYMCNTSSYYRAFVLGLEIIFSLLIWEIFYLTRKKKKTQNSNNMIISNWCKKTLFFFFSLSFVLTMMFILGMLWSPFKWHEVCAIPRMSIWKSLAVDGDRCSLWSDRSIHEKNNKLLPFLYLLHHNCLGVLYMDGK